MNSQFPEVLPWCSYSVAGSDVVELGSLISVCQIDTFVISPPCRVRIVYFTLQKEPLFRVLPGDSIVVLFGVLAHPHLQILNFISTLQLFLSFLSNIITQ